MGSVDCGRDARLYYDAGLCRSTWSMHACCAAGLLHSHILSRHSFQLNLCCRSFRNGSQFGYDDLAVLECLLDSSVCRGEWGKWFWWKGRWTTFRKWRWLSRRIWWICEWVWWEGFRWPSRRLWRRRRWRRRWWWRFWKGKLALLFF